MERHNDIEIIEDGKVISRIVKGAHLDGIFPLLAPYGKIFVVHDSSVSPIAEKVSSYLEESFPARFGGIVSIEATEKSKNIDTVLDICSFLLENKADRNSLVLGIGGGITTDMTGFAASVYKRGVHFAFIPTTLLSQVDAAIGGKTGVNFLHFKNMLGVIRQPDFTFLCPEPLETLSERDFVSGSAEMLKTFILDNGPQDNWYGQACSVLEKIHSHKDGISTYSKELLPLIFAAASVKAGVVSRDQFEKGERRLLNLGHTFAHAIEHLASNATEGNGITHGEAVAMGIILAAKLSASLGLCENSLSGRLMEDFRKVGLPYECPFTLEAMKDAMSIDKKAEGNIIHFILPEKIGHALIKDLTVEEAIDLISKHTFDI